MLEVCFLLKSEGTGRGRGDGDVENTDMAYMSWRSPVMEANIRERRKKPDKEAEKLEHKKEDQKKEEEKTVEEAKKEEKPPENPKPEEASAAAQPQPAAKVDHPPVDQVDNLKQHAEKAIVGKYPSLSVNELELPSLACNQSRSSYDLA